MTFKLGMALFVVAALVACMIVVSGMKPGPTGGDGVGGKVYLLMMLLPPLWLLLAGGYAVAVAGGALDFTGWPRAACYGAAILAASAIAVSIGTLAAFHTEPVELRPIILLPMAGWLLWALPTLAIGGGIMALDGLWRRALAPALLYGPVAAAAAISFILLFGLIVEALV